MMMSWAVSMKFILYLARPVRYVGLREAAQSDDRQKQNQLDETHTCGVINKVTTTMTTKCWQKHANNNSNTNNNNSNSNKQ